MFFNLGERGSEEFQFEGGEGINWLIFRLGGGESDIMLIGRGGE